MNQAAIQHTLQEWIDRRIMVALDGRYLSLALCTPGEEDEIILDRTLGLA